MTGPVRQLLPVPVAEPDLLQLYGEAPARYLRGGLVASVDGAVAVGGVSAALSGPADRAVFRALRAVCDVVLVGAGTARAEDYRGVLVGPPAAAWRARHGRAPVPPVAVVSRTLTLDPAARLFAGPVRPLVLTCRAAPADRQRALHRVADVVLTGDDDVDLARALAALAERGLGRVLCEGGPQLLLTALRAGLVDELCLTTAPRLVGGGPPLLPGALPEPRSLRLLHLLAGSDGSLLARYAVG